MHVADHVFPAIITISLMVYSEPGDGRDSTSLGNSERTAAIVARLASKNVAPKVREATLEVPAGYDNDTQVVVYLSIEHLLREGTDAFDELIKHFDDKRYSYSVMTVNGEGNLTVGAVCRKIMEHVIECYRGDIHLLTNDQETIYLYRDREFTLAGWWQKNRDHPLWKIQIDALNRAIEFFEAVDQKKAALRFGDDTGLSAEEFDALRKENLVILRRLRKSIQISQQPYLPKSVDSQFVAMTLLPWPTWNAP